MSSNIADLIEEYILRQLAQKQDGKVELRRTDIADKISCAPSQISYVLSTRFTQEKGFVVESRRGLGGYIRIVQMPLKNLIYEELIGKLNADTELPEVQTMAHYLLQNHLITRREAILVLQAAAGMYKSETMAPEERAETLRGMLSALEGG